MCKFTKSASQCVWIHSIKKWFAFAYSVLSFLSLVYMWKISENVLLFVANLHEKNKQKINKLKIKNKKNNYTSNAVPVESTVASMSNH